MNGINKQFQEILKGFDNDPTLEIKQDTIISEFNKIIPEGYEFTIEEKAEALAFSFADRFSNSEDGHYFGAKFVMRNEKGEYIESPSLKQVQPEMIDYWKDKASKVQHPYLVARYAGLAWDLSTIVDKNPDHKLRKLFIQASIDIVKNKLCTYPAVAVSNLRRALEVASKFNDHEFFDPIKDLTLAFEKELNELKKPGPWGFAYDLLVNNKRIKLSQEEESAIIDRLEQKLNNYSKPNEEGKTDPWACEHVVSRLAEYYKKKNLPEEVKRAVLTVGKAYEPLFTSAAPFQVSGWMQSLHKLYVHHQLNDEAEALLKQLREISKKAAQEMGGFEHRFQIQKEEADAFAESFYLDEEEINPIEQIVGRFIPNREDVKNSLHELAKQAPMQFSFPIQITDHKGRTIANIGSLENDEDGRILLQIAEKFNFESFFLHLVLEKGKENGKLNKQALLDFLFKSAIIHGSRIPLLNKAMDYYFSDDFIGFIHVVIPQIEEAIRNLVEINGGKTLRYKDGVYQLRTFDDLLRDDAVKSVFGEDIQLYFRVVFTDPRGWNLRNDACHGMMEYDLFTKQTADRVLHTLLTIGMVRMTEREAEENSTN